VPQQSSKLLESELTGLDEIRVALKHVEELRLDGIDARVEVLDGEENSHLKVTLRSFKELQEYITRRYSRLLVNAVDSAIPLDDFERLVTETRVRLLDDTKRIRAHVRIG
jgi:hypothetical protein